MKKGGRVDKEKRRKVGGWKKRKRMVGGCVEQGENGRVFMSRWLSIQCICL